jgi:chromosomal replication initiation ATPase DnaA
MSTPGRGQLVLDLPHRPARGREDFLVTPANAAAVAMIDRFPDWPSHGAVLLGASGSGKTHLLQVWCAKAGATLVGAAELGSAPLPELLRTGALAIDDAPGEDLDERGLFHLLNLARQTGGRVLMASETDPAQWTVALPDLASRLKTLAVARLAPPDDALLRGVMVKLFADRQLGVEESVISYLMLRMPRSLDFARTLVAALDRVALVEKTAVTRGLAARVLGELAAPGLFPEER